MSAQMIANQNSVAARRWSVSFLWLLCLYSIIPLCLMIQLLDVWLWQGSLKQSLPSSPNHFLLFQILFGTPHIIASSLLIFSNTDYVKCFQKKILVMTAIVAVIFGVGSLFLPYWVFYVGVAAWTVIHVLKQQHGIARGVCRLPYWAYQCLLWTSVAAGICIYIGVFLKNSLTVQQAEWLKHSAGSLCIALVLAAFWFQREVETVVGKWFLWANVLLVIVSFYFYTLQYYFLAILAPRLVHDFSAYTFYVTHDRNKHQHKPQNALYRYVALCRIPIIAVLPLLSFALAFVLQAYGDTVIAELTRYLFGIEIHKVITLGLLGYLALLHYYTESFIWKQDSPCRSFISFTSVHDKNQPKLSNWLIIDAKKNE